MNRYAHQNGVVSTTRKSMPSYISTTAIIIPAFFLMFFAAPMKQVSAQEITPASTLISLDFKDADIKTVLRVISLKIGMNIVAGPEVGGTVTIRLEDVEWEKALNVILRTYDLVYERDGNIIRVTTRERMQLEPVETRTFILNYSTPTEIEGSIQDILTERGRIKKSTKMNMLVITDIPTNLFQIAKIVERLDVITPQAYIDSKIVTTEVGAVENLGLEWGTTAQLTGSSRPTTFPYGTGTKGNKIPSWFDPFIPDFTTTGNADPENAKGFPTPSQAIPAAAAFTTGTLDTSAFGFIFNALKTRASTKVVSNPRIVVMNNQTANIQIGSEVPLPTFERNESTGSLEVSGFEYRDVGVILNVTPHINDEKEILVNLAPEITSEGNLLVFDGGLSAPRFNVTQAETEVLIQNGETIAIGGLLTDNDALSSTEVPYLSDIPLVGKLFRSKRQTPGSTNQKNETLFFVTVNVVDQLGQPVKD